MHADEPVNAVDFDLVSACAEAVASNGDDLSTAAGFSDRTRFIAELYPACHYHRPRPIVVRARNSDFLRHLAARFDAIDADATPHPATILCESIDIRFGYGVLYYPDGDRCTILQETFRQNDRHVLSGPDAGFRRVDVTCPADAVHLLIASAGSFNYGHWLVDDLPHLEAVFALERLHPGTPITIVLAAHNVLIDEVRRRSILVYLGDRPDVRIRFLDATSNTHFARLYHVTPSSRHPVAKSPDALRAMVRRLRSRTWYRRAKSRLTHLAHAPRDAFRRGGRRIFVDRGRARGRNIINRAEVVSHLEALGFETIDPETMNLREQMVLFSQAGLVVGIMGAAMTNTIFCPPGAELIYLAPGEDWSEPFYWDLAAIGRHRYAVVFGEPAPSGASMHVAPFSITMTDLDAALRMTRAGGLPARPRAPPDPIA